MSLVEVLMATKPGTRAFTSSGPNFLSAGIVPDLMEMDLRRWRKTALTLTVRLIMFPLANKSYESMSKMRTLQPKMEEIKKKFKDDPQKQQQETMALYQKEKINPVAGCLPLVLQIPVFYALYKVLTVTIEMRHQPFLGFIHDLSARDPSVVWNLFGLIPWNPATLPLLGGLLVGPLGIGLLAVAYGLTMWLQTAMNPPAADPVQRQIFQFMPLVFTFIMAPFAAGLLVYWITNNTITFIQQYLIMWSHGKRPDIFGNIRASKVARVEAKAPSPANSASPPKAPPPKSSPPRKTGKK